VLEDVPRRLEIEYFWAIPADGCVAEFAAALFSIWLGDRPFDESLKSQPLGTD